MKSLNKIAALCALTILAASCGDSASDAGSSSSGNDQKVVACYQAFDYDLEKFLSKEDVLQHIPAAMHSELKQEQTGGKNRYASLTYKYKSDRMVTLTMGSISQEVPDFNTISLNSVDFYESDAAEALEKFETMYKKLSDAELNTMIENLEKSYADKPKEQLEQAKKFVEARKNLNYEPVAGLGTAAYWQAVSSAGINIGVEVKVLVGTMEFTVLAKMSADNSENLKVATAVAKDILKKCS